MKRLFSATLLAVILCLGMSAKAQTEAELQQEFLAYANQYGVEATQNYVLGRLFQITAGAIAEEAAFALIERALGSDQCLADKRSICDAEFEQAMRDLTITDTIAMAACMALTPVGGPPAVIACFAAVVVVHIQRVEAAKHAHRTCYLRARIECAAIGFVGCFLGPQGAGAPDGDNEIIPTLPECWNDPDSDPCFCTRSPIVVDVAGNGFDLTSAANGVMFNMTGIAPEQISWTRAGSDDALLALDLNANGLIDNGSELFGNFTAQPAPAAGEERNGFAALAFFDHNADGKIDDSDPVYSVLRLWQDRNHNGVSEAEELQPLESLGLKTLFTNYKRSKRVDQHGNEFRYRAKVKDFRDAQLGRWAWDVFLVSSRSSPLPRGPQWQTTR